MEGTQTQSCMLLQGQLLFHWTHFLLGIVAKQEFKNMSSLPLLQLGWWLGLFWNGTPAPLFLWQVADSSESRCYRLPQCWWGWKQSLCWGPGMTEVRAVVQAVCVQGQHHSCPLLVIMLGHQSWLCSLSVGLLHPTPTRNSLTSQNI